MDDSSKIPDQLVAGIDLGSNSFKLMIARVKNHAGSFHLQEIDTIRSTIRLANGLDKDNKLDDETINKALNTLMRFGDRIQNFPKKNVCVIATNTFRIAKNAKFLIEEGEKLLGFPINVISGEDEARLVFTGAEHVSPICEDNRFVIDIGGSSTELIVGKNNKIKTYDSLQLGCVTTNKVFFNDGKFNQQNFEFAIAESAKMVKAVSQKYLGLTWNQVIGSSGTCRAIADIISANHFNDNPILPVTNLGGIITRSGLEAIKLELIKSKTVDNLKISGLKSDRKPVIGGGLSILIAIFQEFEIESMEVSESAIIYGALHEAIISKIHKKGSKYVASNKKIRPVKEYEKKMDRREQEVLDWAEQFTIDKSQADRMITFCNQLYKKISQKKDQDYKNTKKILEWACMLHEIGLVINFRQYQQHSSYIISNKELTAFSKSDQARLSSLVLCHRGRLDKLNLSSCYVDWSALICLRLSFIFFKKRINHKIPEIKIAEEDGKINIIVDESWISEYPFIKFGITKEALSLEKTKSNFRITLL
ncbi:MAG: Ppx/GppA family phosphatase [Methylophilales bacterium]|nr:Ppx/GppA family phosphatase [Methylophilales bacterium]